MPDQSGSSKTPVDYINKIFTEEITNGELEALRIEARDPKVCQDLFNTAGFIEKLMDISFKNELKVDGAKILINICTNEPKSRECIAANSFDRIEELFRTNVLTETAFLMFRLIFIVTIDYKGAEIIQKSEATEKFISEFLAKSTGTIHDASVDGQICVDILRYRYNLLHHNMMNRENAVKEALVMVLPKCAIEKNCTNLIGSCLNICLGHGPENIITTGLNINVFSQILSMMIDLYLENENKDHLGTTLMVALKFVDIDENRRALRKKFLPAGKSKDIGYWRRLLVVPNTSITFLTGEFLLKLCNGNVSRFIRHIGFESSAGFLHAKGLLKGGALNTGSRIDLEGDSSDEEYFSMNPPEPVKHTPLEPETEEEAAELEYLMKRISEFNERSQK